MPDLFVDGHDPGAQTGVRHGCERTSGTTMEEQV